MSTTTQAAALVARTGRVVGSWLLAAAFVAACGSSGRGIRTENISDSARANYIEGMDSLESGNYVDAVNYFQVVAKSPSYVKWASLARLRIADSLFFEDKFAEAAEQYGAFLNQYQGDPNEAYANFMIAKCYYEQMPDDWFVTPPAFEKDLNAAQRASDKLQSFVRIYARSRFLPRARRMLEEVRAMQFAHSNYVAEFYESRDKPAGVVVRLEHMRSKFPELFETEDNLMRLGQAYVRTGRAKDAWSVYRKYLDRFSEGEHAGVARENLESLEQVLRSRGEPLPGEVQPPLLLPEPEGEDTKTNDSDDSKSANDAEPPAEDGDVQ